MVNYNNALSDIRDKNDRRKHKLRSFLYSFFKRQRKQIRRLGDESKDIYVDIHEPITVIIFTATLFFCVTDAILTLFIISEGGEEVNPLMKYLLDSDVMLFFWAKFLLTSLGMLFLVSHKYFTFYRRISGNHILYSVFTMYFALISYEVILLTYTIPGVTV